ncbi:phragmoplast orienting kinesin 2 [Phtheirospermum japonicum]|uniref:Probable N-acetyl-gamma-glutamyl-phosphate reductase, chloroplastic n=1 Tax=Phtheirospermum japonicum TaxID=374723 RepID=A0A830D5S4_9LAMI|nr:phragmoplast orienting kinesin 2 [Phtheirospermum japonicum]
MLREFRFLRRNPGKNNNTEEAENIPINPRDSSNPHMSTDPSRPPLNTIQEPARIPRGISDHDLSGFKPNRVDRTPTKPKRKYPDTSLRTPEKQGPMSKNRFNWAQKNDYPSTSSVLDTPSSNRGASRANLSYSECNSAHSTPTKSVSKPPNPGFGLASGSRPVSNMGARMANYGALPKGIPGSCNLPTIVNTVEVPYFELKEDPSFWMEHNVQVLIRIRPLNSMEKGSFGYGRCLKQDSGQSITWIGQPETRFMFDHVACEAIDQETLFRMVGLPMVENCLSGYNSCMFAYGQTGSGKTHTMLGEIEELEVKPSPNRGMTPRIFEFLFARIRAEEESRRDERLMYNCKCSFLEIYNEQITDLLDPSSTNLMLREDMKKGVYVENLSEVEVHTVGDILQLLTQGASNRKVAATNMNRESSRSHSVFTCVIESRWEKDSSTNFRFARLNLVDLAGSERQKTSGAEGERLKEAANINKSLSTLGHVIMVLVDVANGKPRHIPYRDSRLTFLLQDSLGGNSKTMIIANVSPSICSAAETLNTLKFAQRAKLIQNNAIINEDSSGDVVALKHQILLLKEELSALKREKVTRSLAFGSAIDTINKDEDDCNEKETHGVLRVSCKQLKSLETTLAGALRREQMAEATVQQLQAEIQQLNRLVSQREEDTRCRKMMLKFREDKIQRMESVVGGLMSTDDYLVRENNALHEEIQILRDRIDKNPEVTRFAVENIRLLDQVRQFQDLYEEGEREMLMTEVCELRNQLISSLDGNLKQSNHLDLKGSSRNDNENDLLHKELKRTLSELEDSNEKLNSCLEENTKLRREMEELHASLNVTTSAIQEHACSAEVIKESLVEVPMISNPSITTTRSENEGIDSENIINPEDIMNLQLELDIVKIILQEQRSSHAETEEIVKSLNRELQLSKEMVISVTKDYEQVLDELKNAKVVIEALESQQIQSIDEIEDLRSSNARFEELVTEKELQISNLKELSDLSMYNSPLEAKLKKMHKSLEKAKKLNGFYQRDLASHASDENEMEEVRKQVEAETAEVIVCLQEELSGLQQEVYDSKTKETETREKFSLLETQMKITSEDNASLSEQLKTMRSEWDLIAFEIEDILSGGNEALKDVSDQIDIISNSIPHKRSLIGEQFGKMKKYVFEKELLIEELHRCLKDALDRRDDMECMLRSLRGAALVMTETHQHECSEKDNEIFVLKSELNSKTQTVEELRRLIEHGKEQLETASSCATASLVIVNRLWELNLNDKALKSSNCFAVDIECNSRTGTEIEEEMDNLRCEKEEILASENISRESIESIINQVVVLGDAIESFRDQFELKFNAMDGKIGKLEGIVQESFTTWFQQRELLEDELDDAKVIAAQKSIEASCILEKFEEVQDTMKEADIMINELMIANEALKLNAHEFKAKANGLTSERDILMKEVESSKLCYVNLEKQYDTDFDIMKRTLSELENVITEVKNTSVSFDFLSVKSQFQESTESIRTLLEDVWSEIIVKDCALSVLHLCHMGILLETANRLNAENGLLEHGLCESNSIVSELREHNLKSRNELEMCRVLKGKLLADMKKGFDRISSKVDENGEVTLRLASFENKIRNLQYQEEMMLQRSNDMGAELAVIMKEFDLCNKYTVASIMDHERLLKEKDELLEIELHAKEFESLILSTELKHIRIGAFEVFESLKKDVVFTSLDFASCELMLLEKENGYDKLLFEIQKLQNELESKNGEFGKISCLEKENEKLRDNVAVLENIIAEQEVSQCTLCSRIEDLKSQLGNVNALEEENILLRSELRAYEVTLDKASCKISNLIKDRFVGVDEKFRIIVNEMDRTHTFLEQIEHMEKIAFKLESESSSLQMELSRKDDILKGLLFDLSLLQESASNSKDQKDEMEQVLDSLRALENDFESKSIELEKAVAEGESLEAQLQEKEAKISALELDLTKGEEVINSLSGKYAELLAGAKEALDAKNSMEKDYFETRIKLEDLEMEVAEMEMALDRMSKTTESLKSNLDSVMCQRDDLEGKVVILTNELEMARTLVEENEALAAEAQEMAEIEKVHAEEKEEEVKLLERSIEELECTINVLEQKVDIVKGEAERQRLQREELELELLGVKEQMQNIKSNDSGLKRCLDENEKNLKVSLQRVQLLEKEIATRDAEISQCKAHISELNVHAEAQASEHKQRFKALEAMVEQLKSEVSTTHCTSSPKRLEKSSSKPRGSGSPFKCIGLGLQIKSEKDEELTAGRQRIEELEALATSRQKEILMLKARLAATESMTHDVIRDLLGVKLNMKNYANLMDNQQLHLLVGQTQKHNVEAEVKDQEVANLKQQINEFVKERNGWLEEIERKQAEMMAAHVALEKLRHHEQLLATENEMLKEENNSLKCRNEELSIKLRKTEAILSRVKDELSQFRAANGKNPFINFDEEEQLGKKLKEAEEEKLQLAQKLLGLCTTVLKAAGITKPTTEISLTVAEEAIMQMRKRVVSLEIELEDVKLKVKMSIIDILLESNIRRKDEIVRVQATNLNNIKLKVRRESPDSGSTVSDAVSFCIGPMKNDAIKNSNVKRLCIRASVTTSTPQSLRLEELNARKSEKYRIGVLGASGYTGSEIIRLLAAHPNFKITLMTADRKAGQSIGSVFPHLVKQDLPDLIAVKDADFSNVDAVFCCLPHGTTQEIIKGLPSSLKIVDLSADFRLRDSDEYEEWYGQPHKALELQANLIEVKNIIIDSKSGVSGAGRGAKESNLYTEIAEGIHSYGVTRHRHVPEIEQGLSDAANSKVTVSFTPHLMPMSRGMQSTIYVEMAPGASTEDLYEHLRSFYENEEFVILLKKNDIPHTRHVRGSNYCLMNVFPDRITGRAIIISVIDNLVKGASGQALQNLNLMMGIPESTGLHSVPLFP